VASLHGWIDVAKCLIEFGADVNAQDRWKNTVSSSSSFPALLDAVSFACFVSF
jgi:ankyrin repeat protein